MKTELLLLAAGQSKRFSGVKQLADIQGQPMICHCLSAYFQGKNWLEGLDNGVVVLGANAGLIQKVLLNQIQVYLANSWQQGMGHSLAESMPSLSNETSHVFIGLADQVAITPLHIRQLLETSAKYPERIIAAEYAGRVGVPAIFPHQYFTQLAKLTGDKGAKALLEHSADQVIKVPLPEAAFDIDTVDDLKSIMGS